MREAVTTVMEAVGAVSVVVGIGLIYAPLAFIVGGVALAAAGWLVAR